MKRIVRNGILVVAIAVFIFSAYQLYGILSEYHKGDAEYDSIIDAVVTEEFPEVVEGETPEPIFKVDFETLQEMNPDVVAWLRFDEPSEINYPVVQGPDNDKYLKTTFEGKKNSAGTLFIDVDNTRDFSDRNTFIYGHNMKNGSMFGKLRKYKSKSFCEENPYFYIYTPDGREEKYQIFSVCIVDDTSESYDKSYANDEEYLKYIKRICELSLYDTGVKFAAESQIVSLSTCTNVSDEERLIVHGVKVTQMITEE